ncbi:MAG: type II secretion system F family protein [Chloroflexi bacterium]|nr:type II secretion system F family protein [Chloroflexota bacterium]
MTELIPAILVAGAIFLAFYALATPAARGRVQARLDRLGRAEAMTGREQELSQPFFQRVARPGLRALRFGVSRALPTSISDDLEARIRRAGDPISLHGFVLAQIAAVGIAVIVVVMGLTLDLTRIFTAGFVLGGVGIVAVPIVLLGNSAANRRKAMQLALPDAADLIVTMVEAGMSIDAALSKVALETDGPLSDEIEFAMREMTLGRARRDALLGLAERAQVPEVRTFIQAIVHAQATGVPLARVLRTQSREIRLKKRQRAEESARKAPVKVLLVMILFIMPALMITLLGPALYNSRDFL